MHRRETSLKAVLQQALPKGARERIYDVELIHRRWEEVVGVELARRSEPEALSRGVLTVRVTDPVWGRMIFKLQDRIIPALNRAVGATLVRRINFTRRSRLERGFQDPAPPVRELEDVTPPAAVVEAASAIEEPELKELVVRTATHYLSANGNLRRKRK